MREWDVDGEWEGRCLRDGSGSQDGVPFTLSLKTGWFGRLRGVVREDAWRGGPPQEGQIRGRVKGLDLRIIKWMPVLYMPDGKTAAEHILETQGLDVGGDVAHPPILYEGRYDLAAGAARGVWTYGPYKMTFWVDGATARLEVERATGTWEIRRSQP